MQIMAVDTRKAEGTGAYGGMAWCSQRERRFTLDWAEWRMAAMHHGQDGYTMVAYGAEQAVVQLLYRHRESVRVHYREQVYTHAEWHYAYEQPPMPIWDAFPLAGRLSLPELVKAMGLEPYQTPQRYTWRYLAQWREPCFEHGTRRCPECYGIVDRIRWRCTDHDLPECEECWASQNARAVYEYLLRYSDMAEGYGLKPSRTIGGMAHKVWKRLDNPKPARLRDSAHDKFARQGYFGGRVECFKLGQVGALTYLDVASMYASILSTIELPTPESTRLYVDDSQAESYLDYPGMSDCTVAVPDMYLPPLPLRHGGQLLFPAGRFRGHFSHGELRLARSRGIEIETIHASLCGHETLRPFATFGAGLLGYRRELQRKHDPLEIVVKLMLNSLYGYIGMRSAWESCYVMPLPPGTSPKDWPYHEMQVNHDHILLMHQDWRSNRGKYANPLWAALITAEARLRLYSHMEACGHDLAYCDTDAVMTIGEPPATGTEPGELRHQGFYEESWIIAPKVYRLESYSGKARVAHAGIPRWQLDKLISDGTYVRSETAGIMDAYHSGLEPGRYVEYRTQRRFELGKRTPLEPLRTLEAGGWSDTRAIVLSEAVTE